MNGDGIACELVLNDMLCFRSVALDHVKSDSATIACLLRHMETVVHARVCSVKLLPAQNYVE